MHGNRIHRCRCGTTFTSRSCLDKHLQTCNDTFNKSLDEAVQAMANGRIRSIRLTRIEGNGEHNVEIVATTELGNPVFRFYKKDDDSGKIESLH